MSCIPGGQPVLVAALAYLLFVVLAVVLPALAVFRLLRLAIEPAAVVPLGLGLCAAAYWLGLVAGRPWLFAALLGALVVTGLLVGRRRPWDRAGGPSLRGALPPLAAFAALFAVTQYPLNRCTADGAFLVDSLERVDTAFHVGVTWELANGWPPQVPGLAGVPLDYHFAPHLVRAAALRYAGVHPYDALARFDLTLWTLALILAWRAAASALGARPAVVALMPFTLLLTDLSWLLAGEARGAWLTELLGGNLPVSLFFTNALIPALALALAAIAALARAESLQPAGPARGERARWRVVAALLGLALPFFKVFLALQFLAGLGAAVALARARRATAAVAAPCLLATLLLATGSGARAVQAIFDPLAVVQQARAALGREPAHGAALAASALVWLVLSLGVRVAGLPGALRALRSASSPAVALGAMALLGWPLRLLGRLTADGRFDEAVYFSVQSGALLWFFAVSALHAAAARRRVLLALALAAAALGLPTTVEFVARKATTPPERIPPEVMRATVRLAALSAPGEVVLTPSFSRYPPPPVVFIGRRVPYAEYLPYLEQFAPADLLAERLRAVRRFFKDVDPEAAATAAALRARLVVVYGRETAVERGPLLEPIHAEEGVRIYRIRQE